MVEPGIAIGATALLAAYLAWVGGGALALWSAGARVPLTTHSVLVTLSWTAAGLALYAWRQPALDAATRRAWLLVAGAQIATGIVSLSWVVRLASGNSLAGPLPIQLIAASYDVLLFGAFLTFPVVRLRSSDRATFWFDSAIVASSTAVLTWHLLLRTALVAAGSDWHTSLYALAYPVGDVVLLFAAVVLLLRTPRPGSVNAIRLFAFSILLNTVSDVLFMWAYIQKSSAGTQVFYVGYAIIAWMAVLAASSQARSARLLAPEGVTDSAADARSRLSLLPYATVAALYIALVVHVLNAERVGGGSALHGAGPAWWISRFPGTTLAFGAAIVTAIVVARQIAAQRTNAALVAERLSQAAHFHALVQHSSDVILVLDEDGVVREASPAVTRALGHLPEAIVGRRISDFSVNDELLVQADIAEVVAAGSNGAAITAPCEWRLRDAWGGERWMEALCTNLLSDTAVRGIVVNGRDVSERKQLEAELTHRAYHDPLTGLMNRSRFHAKVVDALESRAARTSASGRGEDGRDGLAVLYVDLDHFKDVNDRHGHGAGDLVLITVADRLRDATRGSDTTARLGGDEFAILLERVRDTREAVMVAERVLVSLEMPISVGHGAPVRVGASIGVACMGSETSAGASLDADALIRRADAAMYAVKERGRGGFELCTAAA